MSKAKFEIPRLRKKYGELVFSMIADQDKHDHMVVELYNCLLQAESDIASLEKWGEGMRQRASMLEKQE